MLKKLLIEREYREISSIGNSIGIQAFSRGPGHANSPAQGLVNHNQGYGDVNFLTAQRVIKKQRHDIKPAVRLRYHAGLHGLASMGSAAKNQIFFGT
ncbi:MAG TPA: hypothetical protein PKX87_02885 [Alphaproteobacteria bacterium]|nr:hypothetical protein [Alphaproteobacteria bacterium]